jgi:DNA-binding phage protein
MPSRVEPKNMKTHPILKVVFQRMKDLDMGFEALSKDSGVSRSTIGSWASYGNPKFLCLDAVTTALGLELIVRKAKE